MEPATGHNVAWPTAPNLPRTSRPAVINPNGIGGHQTTRDHARELRRTELIRQRQRASAAYDRLTHHRRYLRLDRVVPKPSRHVLGIAAVDDIFAHRGERQNFRAWRPTRCGRSQVRSSVFTATSNIKRAVQAVPREDTTTHAHLKCPLPAAMDHAALRNSNGFRTPGDDRNERFFVKRDDIEHRWAAYFNSATDTVPREQKVVSATLRAYSSTVNASSYHKPPAPCRTTRRCTHTPDMRSGLR